MSDSPAAPELPPSETPPSNMPPPASASQPKALERSTREKLIHFAGGFIGWFLINGLVWWLMWMSSGEEHPDSFVNLLILPANIVILIVLAAKRKTRWIALGVLAAWAANLIFSTILGLAMNGACLLPFFMDFGTSF